MTKEEFRIKRVKQFLKAYDSESSMSLHDFSKKNKMALSIINIYIKQFLNEKITDNLVKEIIKIDRAKRLEYRKEKEANIKDLQDDLSYKYKTLIKSNKINRIKIKDIELKNKNQLKLRYYLEKKLATSFDENEKLTIALNLCELCGEKDSKTMIKLEAEKVALNLRIKKYNDLNFFNKLLISKI